LLGRPRSIAPGGGPNTYDAFISYSHAEDRGVAQRLRLEIEKFAKPWYRLRALRVFLDVSSLAAEPALWPSVERGLASARWFILVTSPRAAGSKWVDREIRWWLENRSPDRLLIVLADGSLAWDQASGNFDTGESSALPPALLGAFAEEPRWVTVAPSASGNPEPGEVEMRETVVDVAAAIHGVHKEELEGEAVRERQRTKRWVVGTIGLLSLLVVAAVAAGLIALSQRASAIDQAHVALSRQVATLSERVAGRSLNVAIQLAAAAYQIDANSQTRAALINADTTSPSLVGFVRTASPVTRLAGSGDGRFAVAGLEDGSVLHWRLGKRRPRPILGLDGEALAVAISADGSTVAAAGADGVSLWRDGEVTAKLPVPAGLEPVAAGLSPSGRTLVYTASPPAYGEGRNAVVVASPADPGDQVVRWDSPGGAAAVSVASDHRALFDYGNWEWKDLDTWSGTMDGVGVGAHDFAHAASADGRFWTVTNGAERVEVWSTERDPSAGPTGAVEVPLAEQTGLALSPDGSTLAVTGSGEVYVAAVTPVEESREEEARRQSQFGDGPVVLAGQEADLLAFADDTHLLTAAGEEIGVWDTEQLDRLADAERVPLDIRCTLCGGPKLVVSPDGKRLAATSGEGASAFVQSLQGAPEREVLPGDGFGFFYGAPVWGRDGDLVAFPQWPVGGELDLSSAGGLPADVRAWPGGGGNPELGYGELADAPSPDGRSAIIVDETDTVYRQNLETGEVEDALPGPAAFADAESSAGAAALNATADLLAMPVEGGVEIEELPSRRVVSHLRLGSQLDVFEFAQVAFAGPRLLVQRSDGSLEVWDERGTELQQTIADGRGEGIAGNPTGTFAAMSRDDGTIGFFDLDTGSQIGSFQTPGHSTFFKSGIAFTPDGERLITLSEAPDESGTGVLVQRDLTDHGLLATACRAVGPQLTAAQWRAFVGSDPPGDLGCG
jgi:TIR domain